MVDTPGFDDSYESYTITVERIVDWLAKSFSSGSRLNGVIYLQSIQNVRLQGSALDYLLVFKKLCGNDGLKNIILATTFWDMVEERVAVQREIELCEKFWARLIDKGASIARVSASSKDRYALIERVARNNGKFVLEVQKEVVQQGRDFMNTGAGRLAYATALQSSERELKAGFESEKNKHRLLISKKIKDANQRLAMAKSSTLQMLDDSIAKRRAQEKMIQDKEDRMRAKMNDRTRELKNHFNGSSMTCHCASCCAICHPPESIDSDDSLDSDDNSDSDDSSDCNHSWSKVRGRFDCDGCGSYCGRYIFRCEICSYELCRSCSNN